MTRSAQKIPTTQRFTEIQDIIDNVVVLNGGQACMVVEVKATNFSLQTAEDQQIKINSYAALLNSLSFPIQIVIVSRKVDISGYIGLLEREEERTNNQFLAHRIKLYKDFVKNLIKVNTVLDKNFYIVISFSFLESGARKIKNSKDKDQLAKDARKILMLKSNSVIQAIGRGGISAKILGHDELIDMYYEFYNHDTHSAAKSK